MALTDSQCTLFGRGVGYFRARAECFDLGCRRLYPNDMESTKLLSHHESTAMSDSEPKRATWPFWVQLAINSLTLPAALATMSLSRSSYYQIAEEYLGPIIFIVMFGQLYLLSFWMSFGTWPQHWRGLLIFGTTLLGGFVFSTGTILVEYLSGIRYLDLNSAISYVLPFVAGVPVLAAALLWITNGIFVIPAWYFGAEVGFHRSSAGHQPHRRTFGIAQLFSWTAQFAVPLAMVNVFITLTPEGSGVWFGIVPFLAVIACCSPILVLLSARLSMLTLIACLSLSALIGCSWWMLVPDEWRELLPAWTLVFLCGSVAANLMAFRLQGLRWRRKIESVGVPHA
jgi:hypothetical protein